MPVRQRRRESWRPAEGHAHGEEEQPLAALRHAKPVRIEQPRLDAVAAGLEAGEDLEEEALRCALDQPRHVLGHEHLRPQAVEQADILEEKLLVLLAGAILVFALLAPSLRHLADRRKGLAWRRAVEDIELAFGQASLVEDMPGCNGTDVSPAKDRRRIHVGAIGL